ncbi:MAG: DUF1289 domain-containing protein [Betaproteobacteria bacterium]|nr:MAG: DUF1289 domain-containing protein [Betaproteobacteria bacterium]
MSVGIGKVPSPCNSVCAIDTDSGYCAGCYRTIDEIAGWLDLNEDARRALLGVLEERRRRYAHAIAERHATHAQR